MLYASSKSLEKAVFLIRRFIPMNKIKLQSGSLVISRNLFTFILYSSDAYDHAPSHANEIGVIFNADAI